MIELIITICLIALGFLAGTLTEKNHYRHIRKREQALLKLPVTNLKKVPDRGEIEKIMLVCGSVAISMDYFKRFVMGIKQLFGGRLGLYETLIDRGRREATLRMKESAPWADMIVNFRMESSAIGGQGASSQKNKVRSIELLAYGTAVKFKK